MNQSSIKNESIKSFVISTLRRNLKSVFQSRNSLDVSCSFDMTKLGLELMPNTPLNPLSRRDFKVRNEIKESLLLRGEQEVCF